MMNPTPAAARGDAVAEAADEVIVDHADGLHECVADGGADELEAAVAQRLRHRAALGALGRDLALLADGVQAGRAADEAPEEVGERGAFALELQEPLGAGDGPLDLGAVPDDARVAHQPLDPRRGVARDPGRLEAVEGAPEVVALAQDGDPGEARLEAVEEQLLEERAAVALGNAPLLVVVGDVERIGPRPQAARRLSFHQPSP